MPSSSSSDGEADVVDLPMNYLRPQPAPTHPIPALQPPMPAMNSNDSNDDISLGPDPRYTYRDTKAWNAGNAHSEAIHQAIEASLLESTRAEAQEEFDLFSGEKAATAAASAASAESARQRPSDPAPSEMDLRMRQLEKNLNNKVLPIRDPLGDTLVFVDPPDIDSRDGRSNRMDYCMRYDEGHRIKSEKIHCLNSDKFNDFFRPTAQYKVLGRRKMRNHLPPGIKYVLDLSPPPEGDEAVFLMTELSCPAELHGWRHAAERWKVSHNLVSGEEEFESVADNDIGSDYNPFRHRAAIHRLLHAINGTDPCLDSATKVWTFFKVALYFDCAAHPQIKDWIIRWIYAPPNNHFIEVMPDLSAMIGEGTRCQDLLRDSFSILVGEEALLNKHKEVDGDVSSSWSVHGRRREDLPESLKTRLEYASKTFSESISKKVMALVNGTDLPWLEELPEWGRLEKHAALIGPNSDTDKFKQTLRDYVKGRILWVSCQKHNGPYPHVQSNISHGTGIYPYRRFPDVYNSLTPSERFFTRTFWEILAPEKFDRGSESTCVFPMSSTYAWNRDAVALFQKNRVVTVKRDTLSQMQEKFNQTRLLRQTSSDQGQGHEDHFSTLSAEKRDGYLKQSQEEFAFWASRAQESLSEKMADLNGQKHPQAEESTAKRRKVSDGMTRTEAAVGKKQVQFSLPARFKEKVETEYKPGSAPEYFLPIREKSNDDAASTTAIFEGHLPSQYTPKAADSNLSLDLPNVPHIYPAEPFNSSVSYQHPPHGNQKPTKADNRHPDWFVAQQAERPSYVKPYQFKSLAFDLDNFLRQVSAYVQIYALSMRQLPEAMFDRLDLTLTDTLVNLGPAEWRILPLWAGGDDDGSGGVMSDAVPDALNGFTEAGPHVHTGGFGSMAGSSSAGSSEFDVLSRGEALSSHHTSTVVNGGTETESSYAGSVVGKTHAYSEDGEWAFIGQKDNGAALDDDDAATEVNAGQRLDKGKGPADSVTGRLGGLTVSQDSKNEGLEEDYGFEYEDEHDSDHVDEDKEDADHDKKKTANEKEQEEEAEDDFDGGSDEDFATDDGDDESMVMV